MHFLQNSLINTVFRVILSNTSASPRGFRLPFHTPPRKTIDLYLPVICVVDSVVVVADVVVVAEVHFGVVPLQEPVAPSHDRVTAPVSS